MLRCTVQATPSADTALLFFETNELGFTTEFLGRIRLAAALAALAGVGIYNFALKRTPLRKASTLRCAARCMLRRLSASTTLRSSARRCARQARCAAR